MTSPKLSIYNKKNTASLEAVFYIDCKHNIADYIGCVFACFGGAMECSCSDGMFTLDIVFPQK